MYPLGILDTNLLSPHPARIVRMKTEILVMDNCTSQHIILGNDYLNIYGIEINNHKDRYLTIGDNKRQKFAFSNMPKQISVVSSVKDTYKDEFVSNQLVGAQINPSLSPKMSNELIDVLYTCNIPYASDNELLGAIRGHDVDITLNIDRPYPPVLRRPAYTASPRAREALEKHIQEVIQLWVLRKVGHNEEVEVITPVIITWNNDKSRIEALEKHIQELIQLSVLRKVGHNEEVEVTKPVINAWNNDKSRMVADFRAMNTYTVPGRYPTLKIKGILHLCEP
ncbi:hypothetical protein O181_120364 [Austropuccinia psidii MF-1]|uniref:Reverse transcriptase domain-containing protein n=1 Tax=Austropuccinia psidii MF-1 TaxID=1389203 RepID=A0A9Q3KGG7_9BASI|nr:hypothetical protein [Austropuccinia psidii MF-1]